VRQPDVRILRGGIHRCPPTTYGAINVGFPKVGVSVGVSVSVGVAVQSGVGVNCSCTEVGVSVAVSEGGTGVSEGLSVGVSELVIWVGVNEGCTEVGVSVFVGSIGVAVAVFGFDVAEGGMRVGDRVAITVDPPVVGIWVLMAFCVAVSSGSILALTSESPS
jgi:hypothetical protein